MNTLLILTVFAIHAAEAFHDAAVIKNLIEGYKYAEITARRISNNRKWHIWDSITWCIVYFAFFLLGADWWLIFFGLWGRFVYLQVLLNIILGNKWDYMPDKPGTLDGLYLSLFRGNQRRATIVKLIAWPVITIILLWTA